MGDAHPSQPLVELLDHGGPGAAEERPTDAPPIGRRRHDARLPATVGAASDRALVATSSGHRASGSYWGSGTDGLAATHSSLARSQKARPTCRRARPGRIARSRQAGRMARRWSPMDRDWASPTPDLTPARMAERSSRGAALRKIMRTTVARRLPNAPGSGVSRLRMASSGAFGRVHSRRRGQRATK